MTGDPAAPRSPRVAPPAAVCARVREGSVCGPEDTRAEKGKALECGRDERLHHDQNTFSECGPRKMISLYLKHLIDSCLRVGPSPKLGSRELTVVCRNTAICWSFTGTSDPVNTLGVAGLGVETGAGRSSPSGLPFHLNWSQGPCPGGTRSSKWSMPARLPRGDFGLRI